MPTTIASINLNFGRKPKTQRGEIRDLLQDAEIVAGQEIRFGIKHLFSEDVFTRGVKVLRKGFRLGSKTVMGQEIRLRRHRWATVEIDGIGKVCVISVHMPPRRMQDSELDEAYAASLHKVIRRAIKRGEFFVAIGDFNQTRHEDPADLRTRFGVEWRGALIDLAAIDPRLSKHVTRVRLGPKRWDGHQVVYLTLS